MSWLGRITASNLAHSLSAYVTASRQFDRGEIDEFDLDDLIHRYKRAAADLWKFCGSSGGQWLQAANMLTYLREQGEEPDWWAIGAQRRDGRS